MKQGGFYNIVVFKGICAIESKCMKSAKIINLSLGFGEQMVAALQLIFI